MHRIPILILLLLVFSKAFSQNGRPFIHNFTPQEYSGEDQVWTINQNKNGLMYFGSSSGLLEYDGKSWKQYLINDKTQPILSSVFGDDGLLYVGSVSEFGFFKTNNLGELRYNSLINLLDSVDQLFTDVWSVTKSNKYIYFSTENSIFRYNPDLTPKIKKIPTKLSPFLMYNPDNETFVSFRNGELYKINKDSLIKVRINKPIFPWFMLPYKKDVYLVGSKIDNLELLYFNEKASIARFVNNMFDKQEIIKTNKYLNENQLYIGACVLGNNLYAFGTISSGLVIINKFGKIIDVFSKKDNLLSSTVQYVTSDKQGGLWAGLSYGISRVEYNSPFRNFDEKDGIDGTIYDIIKFKNRLYVSSNLGLFYYENDRFIGINTFSGENSGQVFNLVVFPTKEKKDSIFFVSTINGIYSINGKRAFEVNSLSPSVIFQSGSDISKFYCGLDYKLVSFRKDGNRYSKPKTIKRFNGLVKGGIEIDNENLWLIINDKPIIFNLLKKTIKNFYKNKELDGVIINEITKQNNKVIFLSNKGIYKYNWSKNVFYKDKGLIPREYSSKNIMEYRFVSKKLSWALVGNKQKGSIIKCSKNNNHLCFDSVAFKRLKNYHSIYKDGDSLLWIISSKNINKYNINNSKDFSPKSLPMFSKIIIGEDSVILNGYYINKNSSSLRIKNTISYSFNSIAFEFAFPEFDNEEENEFKFFIENNGKRKVYDWTNDTHKEFSNLYEGHYIFMLKARNVYQKETDYISFEFIVLPPWYRTWWAYLLYVLSLGGFILIIIRLNARKLEQENIRLDNTIKERTAEIYLQKEEIQTQADNLEETNKQLNEKNLKISLIAENLTKANKKINEKNNQITDSINYAKKIQRAILPSKNEIYEIFEHFFIIYKPKDIVGGDFYFLKKLKSHIIVAVADCTGHGVPGGFLSMMGVSFLNEIIQTKKIQNPSQALNSLRQKFKYSLRQNNYLSSSTDGIDIALCSINTTNGILEYAGANSPLLIIRNKKLIKLLPDLQPIGMFFKEKDFSLNSFQLQLNDTIYMFSDGFQDQFGGKNGKKLLHKNFIKILLEYSDLPLNEQKTKILKCFNRWKGDRKQVDDVLVFGFKITKKQFY